MAARGNQKEAVVAITPFDTDAEALELANGVKYGLAAYIWTTDLTRAHTFAQNVEAGMVWLNSHNVRDLRTPFGGVKSSGLGREGGEHSVDFYTESCIVHVLAGALQVHIHRQRLGDADGIADLDRAAVRQPSRHRVNCSRSRV